MSSLYRKRAFFFFYTDPPGRFEPDVLGYSRRSSLKTDGPSVVPEIILVLKCASTLRGDTASVSTANTTTKLSGANGANVPERQFVRAPNFENGTKHFCCNFPIIRTIQRKVIGSSYVT